MGLKFSYPVSSTPSCPPLPSPVPADLLLVLTPGGVQGLDEGGGMANEHGIAGGTHNHAEHGEPDVRHAYRCLLPIANAQHVAHGLEECEGVELAPRVILQGHGCAGGQVLTAPGNPLTPRAPPACPPPGI